jgi:hypothetical protein
MVTVKLEPNAVARLVRIQGERVELVSSVPAAVGSRPSGRLADGRELRFKVQRCVRQGDEFVISARLLDVPRSLRRAIEAALAPLGDEPT